MRAELILPYSVWISALVPFLAVLAWGGVKHSPAFRWIAVTMGLSFFIDTIKVVLAAQGINNHWVSYSFTPLYGAAMVMVLAQGQRTLLERQAVTLTAGLLLVVVVSLNLLFESTTTYSRIGSPVRSLVVFAVSIWTLLRLEPGGPDSSLLRSGWFWVTLGFALYSGGSAAYFPLAWSFLERDVEFVKAMAQVRSALVVFSFLLVTWGVRCLSRETISGPRSSPSSSPSPSSSWRSAPP